MARRVTSSLLLSVLLLTLVPLLGVQAQRVDRLTTTPGALHTITVGMGYVPNVQFAPFYVAAQRGYYRRAGLKVTFIYGGSPNLLQLVGAGRIDFANADGTDAIAAVAKRYPIVYVMAEYQKLPLAIFSLAQTGIRSVADLRGKTVGVPFLYGANYVGLLAALRAAGLRPTDVKIQAINFTQSESVATGKVNAAVGYSTNEPLLLARHGYKVSTLQLGNVTDLVAPGIVAGRTLIAHDPTLVAAFVQATLDGLADTIKDPRMAFATSRRVPGLTTLHGAAIGDQYAVLTRAIDFWHSPLTRVNGLGYANPAQWHDSARILRAIGQVSDVSGIDTAFTNRFIKGAAKL